MNHLQRCKTSTSDFTWSFFILLLAREKVFKLLSLILVGIISFHFKQGGSAPLTDTPQLRHCQFVVIQSLISSAYLHRFIISLNGNGPSPEPSAFSFFTAQSSQSFKGGNDLVQMDTLHLARTLKEFLRTVSRLWSSTNSCQV